MAGNEELFQKAMNQGHSAAWDQNWSLAASAYLQALREIPDSAKALNSYALAQFQLQQYEDALRTYMRAARVSPEDPTPFEKISQINERLGNVKDAAQAALYAAELYLKLHDLDKALENWSEVIQLDAENLQAYSRLALVHEKIGNLPLSTQEYIAAASILQKKGNPQKAAELLNHAFVINPRSEEVREALKSIGSGQILPVPVRPKGGTSALRMAAVKQMSNSPAEEQQTPDPVVEARQKALKIFADVLFDIEDDSREAAARRELAAIVKAAGRTETQEPDHTQILRHLGAALDAQMRENEAVAVAELQHAVEAGFDNQAAFFDIGLMLSKTDQKEKALESIQKSAKHIDYALAAQLISGKILRSLSRLTSAATHYLEALKIADVSVVSPAEAETIQQLYEPLIESIGREKDSRVLVKLCDNVDQMLMRDNWRQYLQKMREGMSSPDGQALPLAEIIIQAQSSQVIDAMKRVNELVSADCLRSAVDEAFHALRYAPTYLPLHIQIADLMLREDRKDEAIIKLGVVANAYAVRGEVGQATAILKRVLQLAPMDMIARNRLIEQLLARGLVDEAIGEYFNLADIYYRLAELDMARKVFTTALHESQQPNANRSWSVKILQRMADIDMQRLDLRQAIRVFEQLRTLIPADSSVRENLVELYLRMGQVQQAQSEVEAFIAALEVTRSQDVIPFLQKLLETYPEQVMIARLLADQLYKHGHASEAISQLDALGEKLMRAGDKAGLTAVVNQILLMKPENAEQYRTLLEKI